MQYLVLEITSRQKTVMVDMLSKNKHCQSEELKVRVQKWIFAAASKLVTYSCLPKPSGYPRQSSGLGGLRVVITHLY